MKYLMQKLIVENYSSIDKKRCLYQRKQATPCSICQDHCPTGAISRAKNCIEIDEDTCKGCGICKSKCPSQAITLKEFGELKNLQNIKEKDVILVGCTQEESGGNILFPCLNGLHKEYLVILMLVLKDKNVHFNLSQCESCYIEKGCRYFLEELGKAEAFIDGLGLETQVALIYDQEELPNYSVKEISRRELFTLLKDQSVNVTLDATNSMIGRNNTKEFRTRDLLLDILKADKDLYQGKAKGIESIFTSWNVDTKCDGCGFCEAICPWKAWHTNKSEKVAISHDARSCRSCNLCYNLCPQQAISKGDFSLNQLEGSVVKATISLVKCSQCNTKYVLKATDQTLCHTCSKREKLRKSLI